MEVTNPPFSPLLGENDRETMGNVYDVLAFVSRAAEVRVETAAANCRDDVFGDDEMHGLSLICRVLMQALAGQPALAKVSTAPKVRVLKPRPPSAGTLPHDD